MPKSLSCLTCRSAYRVKRGNCDTCYCRHRKAVRAGRTSWRALQRGGLAAAVEGKGKRWMAAFDRWLRAGKD
jgi:hypothetical protein